MENTTVSKHSLITFSFPQARNAHSELYAGQGICHKTLEVGRSYLRPLLIYVLKREKNAITDMAVQTFNYRVQKYYEL